MQNGCAGKADRGVRFFCGNKPESAGKLLKVYHKNGEKSGFFAKFPEKGRRVFPR